MMKLTKLICEKAVYQGVGNKRHVLWDDEVRGFGLRVYPSQRKAFIVKYRTVNGRQRQLVIGDFGTWTVDLARKEARKYIVGIDQGDDPVEERRAQRDAITVADLCAEFMKRWARDRKRSWHDDQLRLDKHVLPVWGTLKAASIIRADMAALHHKVGKESPGTANRTLDLVRTIWNKAVIWGLLPEGHVNPAVGVERNPERPR
ncbi:MAG: DUF4102 domain-containing protein, partial [Bradymonadales bacterium]|nr:DUF4102 domain-containing protein [Bradymonadales bacterium]